MSPPNITQTTPKSASKQKAHFNECEECGTIVSTGDIEKHYEDCLSDQKNYDYSYIKDKCLFGKLQLKKNLEIKGFTERELDDFVFLSPSCMQICGIANQTQTIIKADNLAPIVKRAWPTIENNLTSVNLTGPVLKLYFGDVKTYPNVSVAALTQKTVDAKQIIVKSTGRHPTYKMTKEIEQRMCLYYSSKILTPGNRIRFFYSGRFLKFFVEEVIPVTNQDDPDYTDSPFFEVTLQTKWILLRDSTRNSGRKKLISKIGGLDEQIKEIRKLIKSSQYQSVLLHGSPGTGKTMLAKALAEENDSEIIELEHFLLVSNAEEIIKTKFENASRNGPTVIVLDQIDRICGENLSETARKIRSVVWDFLENISKEEETKVSIIAITNNTYILSTLQAEIFKYHIEIPIPNPQARKDILYKMLDEMKHKISDDQLKEISEFTHGFVGEDLNVLFSNAKRHAEKISKETLDINDFYFARDKVKPKAMSKYHTEVCNVKWSEVAVQEEIKHVLEKVVQWPLKYPEYFLKKKRPPSKGILMYGPPGCAKTMIVKALATESRMNFFSVKGAELLSKYVGDSERAVRDLFRNAKQASPSIIFFDEIDVITRERSSSASGDNVRHSVLTALLIEMDGVSPIGQIIVIAATNRPDIIDKALLRPGRFDHLVYMPLPDTETRKKILDINLGHWRENLHVDIGALADSTENYSGAEIENLCSEAVDFAFQENKNFSVINANHFALALKRVTPNTSKSAIQKFEQFRLKKQTVQEPVVEEEEGVQKQLNSLSRQLNTWILISKICLMFFFIIFIIFISFIIVILLLLK